MIERTGSKDEVRSAVAEARREGRRIGLVPTMGALHEGHLALVHAACARTDFVVVSIFVNPTQFAPGEDFERYPRMIDADLVALGAENVELVFTPATDAMYAQGSQVTVDPGPLGARWEGEVRPGHFSGVATVVTKLLSIVRPDLAFFGEKDYQQLKIVQRMAADLDLGAGIVPVPIVREPDGLALSSRNAFLSAEQRLRALSLSEALEAAASTLAWGERDARALESAMREAVGDRAQVDYAAVVDAETLEPLDCVESNARALIAARIGQTRLIDNCALTAPAETGGAR